MIARLALIVLLLLVAFALAGRWSRHRVGRRPAAPPIESARRCPVCDAYVVGSRPEPCARADCRFRRA